MTDAENLRSKYINYCREFMFGENEYNCILKVAEELDF